MRDDIAHRTLSATHGSRLQARWFAAAATGVSRLVMVAAAILEAARLGSLLERG